MEKFTDFIFLQEHWLYNYELCTLNDIHPAFAAAGKAVDDDNPITAFQKPRGYGGVAVLWRKIYNDSIKILDDGNSRIQAITYMGNTLKYLFISCYMPTRGATRSDEEYEETLAQLEAIINKQSADKVIVGGDFNVDLGNPLNCNRKRQLQKLIQQQNLVAPLNKKLGPTFIHTNGTDSSSIDYFFTNMQDEEIAEYRKLDQLPTNTSDHYPIKLGCNTGRNNGRDIQKEEMES